MPIFGIMRVYETWVQVGGNTGDIGIYMTAIAMAESGGNTTVISGSGDFGLWQINQSAHAAEFPRLWPQWDDPIANARMAKAISGNGTNIGPWCTAWADPTNCGHYHSPPPDAGSPAGVLVQRVAAAIGAAPPPVRHLAGGFQHPGERPWGHWQHLLGAGATERHNELQRARQVLRRI